jgi:hypothetical protein
MRKAAWTVTGIVALVLSIFLGIPLWRLSYWIPHSPPTESNRVFHPKGFSIIKPPRWTQHVVSTDELNIQTISLYPEGRQPKHSPGIRVALMNHRPESLDGYMQTTFQGTPAHHRLGLGLSHETKAYIEYSLLFERSGQWFAIAYFKPDDSPKNPSLKDIPARILEYLDTFKFASGNQMGQRIALSTNEC